MKKYYVSNKGDDNNLGTSINNPFATIAKAVSIVEVGDTVYVTGGIYTLNTALNIRCKGTEREPITFKAYNHKTPVIELLNLVNLHPKEYAINFEAGTEYIIFEGFEIRNCVASAVRAINCSHITIRNCIVHDIGHFGISIRSDNCLVEKNEIYNIAMAWEGGLNGAWPQAVNTYYKPPIPPATVGSYAYNNVFRENYIHDCWAEGIDPIFGDGVVIENNIIRDVFSCGIYLDNTRNAAIRNNYIYTTTDKYNRRDDKAPMIGVGMGTEYFGVWSDNPPISHNENIQIYNNVFSRVGTGFMQWYDYNNTDYNNTYENLKIYNNTVDTWKGDGYGIRFAINLPITPTGNEIKNNIFRANKKIIADGDLIFSNNLWINGIPEQGNHEKSIIGEPDWVNPIEGGDISGYRLKETSQCVGRGQTVEGLATDQWGNQRNNPPCLGAHEVGKAEDTLESDHISFIEEVIPQTVPSYQVGVNVLYNCSFDEDGIETSATPKGWQSSGDVYAAFVTSPGFSGGIDCAVYEGKFSMRQGNGKEFEVYTYQTVEQLPKGRYGLHARVRRFGTGGTFYMEASDFGACSIKCNIPFNNELSIEMVDYKKDWLLLNMSDIVVENGKCTVGFYGWGGSEDYVLIDEVWLYRY